ncbi:chaperonin 10-like protein [Aspergillus karnatakaensis]|uniref:NAD(P)-dependent alcohol dehydrogenase n=1 Tax=Aspergillus karnatakaensis TaxID=1810916 RepID=UPI003CCD46DE
MDVKVIVAREPTGHPNWSLEGVTIKAPSDDEVLVKITATGICHTDILLSSIPSGTPLGIAYPKIPGHEGAGIIEAVGKNITSVAKGDKILLSYYSCADCSQCQASKPMYCSDFNLENYVGRKGAAITIKGSEEETWSRFFGQSSFAEYALAAEASVVKVNHLLESDDELNLFAPLGCGFQTGMGAIVNVANAGPDDVVLIMGMGAVGMAALMAAKIRNSKTIIAVDRFASRLESAELLGATHIINTTIPEFDFQQAVRSISSSGASVIVDTTGVGWLIDAAVQSLSSQGKMVHVASPPPGYKLGLDISDLFMNGKTITGCIEGNCIPSEAIPQMIKWYREGRFPIDKLITFFPAAEFGSALEQLHSGAVLKPVLTW